MARMNLRVVRNPSSPRQIARILARGLVKLNMLEAKLEGEALDADGGPAMFLEVADPTHSTGVRTFVVRVEEVAV